MSQDDPSDPIPKLFALTEAVHVMATQEMAGRLSRHVERGMAFGHTIAVGHRIRKEGEFDGVLLLIAGKKVSESDADGLVEYAKGMLHDIDPKASAKF